MRLAIVGLGQIFEHHLRALSIQGHSIVAVCDLHRERLALAPASAAKFTSLSDMLAVTEADAVLVATSTADHFEHALAVLRAGFPLVLEKPAALCQSDYDVLKAVATAAALPVAILFHAAHANDLRGLAAVLKQRPLKRFAWHGLFCDPYDDAERRAALLDPWVDSGVNALSVVVQVLGTEIDIHHCISTNIFAPNSPSRVAASAVFTVDSGDLSGQIVIETSWASARNHKSTRLFDLNGAPTRYELDHSLEQLSWSGQSGHERTSYANEWPRLTNHYVNALSEALALIKEGKSNWNFADAVHAPYFRAMEKKDWNSQKSER